MDNNQIFKKLRAYMVKRGKGDADIIALFALAGAPISRNRYNGIKSAPTNPHYREMTDDELTALLDGMIESESKPV